MRNLNAEAKESFRNLKFLLALAGVVVTIFISSIDGIISAFRTDTLLQYGYHASLILSALSSDAFTLALPILCVLPYTTSFVDDIKSGFIKEYLPRTTVRNYLSGKIIACALSGGAVLAIGVAFAQSGLSFAPAFQHDLQAEAQQRRPEGDAGRYGARGDRHDHQGLRAYSRRGSKAQRTKIRDGFLFQSGSSRCTSTSLACGIV